MNVLKSKNTFFKVISIFFISFSAFAHIGSAGVVHEGKAGNYSVQVYVEPPDVIPGTAKVSELADGNDIKSVKMSPIYYLSQHL